MKNMYDKNSVLAVIVSYNCTEIIKENVASLFGQTGEILVIDNGSGEDSLKILNDLRISGFCKTMLCDCNEGIPVRLNQALEYAVNKGYELLLTMDQDTVLDKAAVSMLLEVLNIDNSVVSVGPRRGNKRLNEKYYYKDYLITSGNLVKISAIKEVGGFKKALFVDMIDIDISLSLRKHGYKLAIANEAQMKHKVGEIEERTILGMRYRYLSHSPDRFFFIYRNTIIINRLYYKDFKAFCLKLDFFKLLDFIRIFFENDRKNKFNKALAGIKAGFECNL